jgi:uncharacterized caspase-like protein
MTRYALLVGVDYHNDPKRALPCTEKDVSSLKSALLEKGYDEDNIKTAINETTEVVCTAISLLFAKTRQVGDVCFFYFSGHGELNDAGDRVCLAMNDTSTISPAFLSEEMKDCPAQQVVIIDCCFSGKITKDTIRNSNSKPCAALASSTSSQYSRISRENSSFTQYLVEGIKKDLTTIAELRDYISKKLLEKVLY